MHAVKPVYKNELTIPSNIVLEERDGKLTIQYSWFKFKYLVMTILAPLCCYVLITSDYIKGDFREITTPVILLMVAAVIMIYVGLAKLINTTRIDVNKERMVIKHGPLPFSPNVVIEKNDLEQLYVARHREAHRYYLLSTTFMVNAITKSQGIITLLKGLSQLDQSRFIEDKIEEFFGIIDVEVDGEVSKK